MRGDNMMNDEEKDIDLQQTETSEEQGADMGLSPEIGRAHV